MISSTQIKRFNEFGFLVVENFLTEEEVNYFRQVYEDFLNGNIETDGHRSDLSGLSGKGEKEKITQIMRPSLLLPSLEHSALHIKATRLTQQLMGDDMALDFDMLIDKSPNTNTITPWHQDEAYWIDMEDKRAVTCWVALDDVIKESGCMWFVPGSHKQRLREHKQTGKGGALECVATEEEAIPAEIKAGSCTLHHGKTIHYSRGNSTSWRRRAFITNFRPEKMIAYERAKGFNHLGKREIRQSKK